MPSLTQVVQVRLSASVPFLTCVKMSCVLLVLGVMQSAILREIVSMTWKNIASCK